MVRSTSFTICDVFLLTHSIYQLETSPQTQINIGKQTTRWSVIGIVEVVDFPVLFMTIKIMKKILMTKKNPGWLKIKVF